MDELLQIQDGEDAEVQAWLDADSAMPRAVRERFGFSCTLQSGLLQFSAPGLPGPLFNRVLVVDPEANAAALDSAMERLSRAGRAYLQLPPGARFDEARARVEGRAGQSVGAWAKFHSTEPGADATTELFLRELDSSDASAFARLVCRSFGLPVELEPWLLALVDRPRWRAFGAFDGDRLVGTGASFLTDGPGRRVAWLGFGAVDPEFRRRGAQGAILGLRRRAALAEGAAAVVSETGKPRPGEDGPSFRNLSRTLGLAYVRDNFLIPPPAS